MTPLQRLQRLAENDERLAQISAQLERSRLPELDARLERMRQGLAQLREKLAQSEALIGASERELSENSIQLKRVRDKLYGGSVSNSKELLKLEADLETLQLRRNELEETALNAMEELETLTAQAARAEKDQAEAQEDREEARVDEEETRAQLMARRRDLEALRLQLQDELGESTLQAYERARQRNGKAITKVKGGLCLACRMGLPDALWRAVKHGELLNCPSCASFLSE